jgi:hypothetical protein
MSDKELAERLVKILQAQLRTIGEHCLKVGITDTFMKASYSEQDLERALNYAQSAGWIDEHVLTIEITEEGVKVFAQPEVALGFGTGC